MFTDEINRLKAESIELERSNARINAFLRAIEEEIGEVTTSVNNLQIGLAGISATIDRLESEFLDEMRNGDNQEDVALYSGLLTDLDSKQAEKNDIKNQLRIETDRLRELMGEKSCLDELENDNITQSRQIESELSSLREQQEKYEEQYEEQMMSHSYSRRR